ncbi:hypothetical protein D3C79_797620 [compost metagenome]
MRRLTVDRRNVLDHPAKAVFTYGSFARLPGQPAVEALLYAFNPLTVDVGHADNMRGHLAGRIVAARLLTQVNARQFQLVDVVANRRIHLARQVDKAPFRVGVNAGRKLIQRDIQRIRQCLPTAVQRYATALIELFRVGPNGVHRHAHRQRPP